VLYYTSLLAQLAADAAAGARASGRPGRAAAARATFRALCVAARGVRTAQSPRVHAEVAPS
jgi:hypothetical protein